MKFSRNVLDLDVHAETERIIAALKHQVHRVLRRYGVVVGISGGVDSSVVLALALKAFGSERVAAVMMPEKDSDPESEAIARRLAAHYGIAPLLEVITPALEGFNCYARRDEAIRRVFPEYDAAAGYKAKIVLPPNLLEENTLNFYSVTIVLPDGTEKSKPLLPRDYLQIVAASNFKQRTRMSFLYYHAELRNYAVAGTANRNEHDQGFFVKFGDSGVDVKVLGHLFKTQVYQLARFLDVPEEIIRRTPTSDTYSAPASQQEFFFRLPFEEMDLLWYAQEYGYAVEEVAAEMSIPADSVRRAFDDFSRKQRTTCYLRTAPVDLGPPVMAAPQVEVQVRQNENASI